jgi:hypothetical protein
VAQVERFTSTNRFLSALARVLVADHVLKVPAS